MCGTKSCPVARKQRRTYEVCYCLGVCDCLLPITSVYFTGKNVTLLVEWTHSGILAWAETYCLGQGGSFPQTANNKTDAKTGTAQALFNGQRMEQLKLSLQINVLIQFRWRHPMYRRVEVKGRELKKL